MKKIVFLIMLLVISFPCFAFENNTIYTCFLIYSDRDDEVIFYVNNFDSNILTLDVCFNDSCIPVKWPPKLSFEIPLYLFSNAFNISPDRISKVCFEYSPTMDYAAFGIRDGKLIEAYQPKIVNGWF